ncbi:MAG: cytochrome c oxidase accessory protein CcoG [Gammaproteobacteria bacterium]|nr:cytochrome c oxidase accessory protein CcoG [Gammaproteobacteria bacterium]
MAADLISEQAPASSAQREVLLYQSAAKIQPRRAAGRYARLRIAAVFALLGLYYVLPWLHWHGVPLVRFDLPDRRFRIFGLMLVPQDLLLLALLLLLAALTLFFVTSLAGRLWCGYACPQTVWTEAFLWIEHLCEGDRHARLKLDRGHWNGRKILRRGGKHVLWAVFSLFTGATFVAYFIPARELFPALAGLRVGGWPLFWTLFYGFATWGNAGFMREQVCKYMCPYARFQSAMFNQDTLIIAYDDRRGEPRKSAARKEHRDAGDCVDCSLCVQVCPTGIDIREGLQYECIACAACVDVCNTVMDSVDRPRGLIRYTSARRDAGGRSRLLHGRTLGYGAVWLAACAGFVFMVLNHSPLSFDVLRDRHTLYRELASGAIENVYVFKVTNDDDRPHRYRISARFADGTPLTAVPDTIERRAGETGATTGSLRTPPRGEHAPPLPMFESVLVEVRDVDSPQVHAAHKARFLTGDFDSRTEDEHAEDR